MSEIVVSVVLPCLNEQDSVGLCVTESLEAMAAGGLAGEVIVVDNGSTDASVEVATQLALASSASRALGMAAHCWLGSTPPPARSWSWPTPTSPMN